MIGKGHNCGTIGGNSQDPIGIKVKGINDKYDRSGGGHHEGHVVVMKITGHMVASHNKWK